MPTNYMTIIPKSNLGRVLAGVWILLCFGGLLFGWVQQSIHDMPIAFVWFMFFLTGPVGVLFAALVGMMTSLISENLGIIYRPFWDLVPMWIPLTVTGYFQWLVIVPLIWKRINGELRRRLG
jgi:hypothetical protein